MRYLSRSVSRLPASLPRLVLTLFVALPATSPAAVLTVGSDLVECDFVDLQQALAAAASGDTVQIAGGTYTGAAGANFNITAKSLTLAGGYDGCSGSRPSSLFGAATLLQGGGSDTVVEIGGTTNASFVLLDRLTISGGTDDGDDGGGIGVSGNFAVTLIDVTVRDNAADRGAGIHLDGAFGASLYLEGSTVESNQAAVDGAGIYCEDGGEVRLQDDVVISGNAAAGDGGGLWSDLCVVRLGGVRISGNTVGGNGGGIFASGGSEVFDLDGAAVSIRGNEASSSGGFGGGVYATGTGVRWPTSVHLDDAGITDNRATVGGGVYATDFAIVDLDPGSCGSGKGCNRLEGNAAVLATAVAAFSGGQVLVSGWEIVGNGDALASGPFLTATAGGRIEVEASFLHDNSYYGQTPGVAVYAAGGSVELRETTAVGHRGIASFFGDDGLVRIDGAIFWDNDGPLFPADWAGNGHFHCGVVPPGTTIPVTSSGLIATDPHLADAATGDLHLRPDSPAVDLCASGSSVDVDGDPRPVGAGWDAGADELAGVLFADGFESGGVSVWSAAVD